MGNLTHTVWRVVLAGSLTIFFYVTGYAQEFYSFGVGPDHRSMAGASTAGGTDALGNLFWNPAAIRGQAGVEAVFAMDAFAPNIRLLSYPSGQNQTVFGVTSDDSDITLMPSFGLVIQPENSSSTFGLAVVPLVRTANKFPSDPNNPLLTPGLPLGQFSLGSFSSRVTVYSIMPTIAFDLNDQTVLGLGALLDFASMSFGTAFFGPLNDGNVSSPLSFPTDAHTNPTWGGGLRAGLTYQLSSDLKAGIGYITPQRFGTLRFQALNESGESITFTQQFSLPMIFTTGVSYTGLEKTTLNVDARWLDYSSTKLLGEPPPSGGAGWKNVWSVAIGGRYKLTEQFSIQAGYLFNQNPTADGLSLASTTLLVSTPRVLTLGVRYDLSDCLSISAAYAHGFSNANSGIVFPIPVNTTLDTRYDSVSLGLTIKL